MAPEALHAIQEPYRVDIEEWRVFNTPSSLDSRCYLLHHHSRCVLNWPDPSERFRRGLLFFRVGSLSDLWGFWNTITPFVYRRHLLS